MCSSSQICYLINLNNLLRMPAKNPEKPAFKLKDIYGPELIATFAASVQENWLGFPVSEFQDRVFNREWENLELKERMRYISSCLRDTLPADYPGALDILVRTTEQWIKRAGEKMAFEYGFLPDFVERFGLEHPDLSIPALEQMTFPG